MDLRDVLTSVHGKPITVEDVIVFLKANGTFRNSIYQMISNEVTALKSRDMGIDVAERELQDYTALKRQELGLQSAVEMNDYCKWLGVTYDQWERSLEAELLRCKLRKAMYPEATIREIFDTYQYRLRSISLSRIVGSDRESLRRILDDLRAGQGDFATLARECSVEESSRMAGGYLGTVRWGMLPQEIEETIFTAEVNDVIGPLQQDGYWVLYRIDDIRGGEYTEELREQIRDWLFSDWLEDAVRNAAI